MPSNPFSDNSSSTLVTAAATVVAGLAVTYHLSRRVPKGESERVRGTSACSEREKSRLDLSSETAKLLTEGVQDLCINHILESCRTGSVCQGGVDLAADDQTRTDDIMSEFLQQHGLGPLGESGHIPNKPMEFSQILDTLKTCVDGPGINTAHCGYMGHIGGGGVFAAALADYFLAVVNRQSAVRQVCPGLNRLEMNVIRWFATLAGYDPERAGGVFTSGASLSTVSAIICARYAALDQDPNLTMGELITKGTIYVSAVAHGCVAKGFVALGFSSDNIREVRCFPGKDKNAGEMDVAELRVKIQEDEGKGFLPFIVVANGGATPTGSVDNFEAFGRICHEERRSQGRRTLWCHADAAYGFFFRMIDDSTRFLKDIDRADSIALDAHKSLGLPYGTGAILVKNHDILKKSHSASKTRDSYLPKASTKVLTATSSDEPPLPELVDFCDYSLELSRPYRGLRVWFALKLFGTDAFRDNLVRFHESALRLARSINETPGLQVLHWPTLAIFTFSVSEKDGADLSNANKRLLAAINQKGGALLTGAVVDGVFLLRVALSCFRTRDLDISALLETVVSSRRDMDATASGV
eukprot:TRINITY_DN61542_c0_g1_i1.p1 TRINITY_DN61542_c0_g1~~TRINITY_DN61542_c0_g1_i1.p1  ORF type:complete len:584 (+),score=64.16 TRINITY_DN61542_c0_g1_i1:87-1838(+)